jgi:hypothetical protein
VRIKHLADDAVCPSKGGERERERQRERQRETERQRERQRGRTIIMLTTDSYVDAKIVFALHGLDIDMSCKETLS